MLQYMYAPGLKYSTSVLYFRGAKSVAPEPDLAQKAQVTDSNRFLKFVLNLAPNNDLLMKIPANSLMVP